jgi:hypothetical protein
MKKARHATAVAVSFAFLGALIAASAQGSPAAPRFDPNFHIYLLIGQSNMEGVPQPQPQDTEPNPRIKVLAYADFPRLGRTYNEWSVAIPPLHSTNLGVGPGDYFAKRMIASMPEGVTIGLVPCGIAGVDIDFFRKGVVSNRRAEFRIPPDNHWSGAYDWVLARARLAQQYGVIKGILLHQGESDSGQVEWIGKVNEMVKDLRSDLGIPNAPIVIGELLYGGACQGHNQIIRQAIPAIPNAYLVSAEGLKGVDSFHFDLEGQRALGRLYAVRMLEALGY